LAPPTDNFAGFLPMMRLACRSIIWLPILIVGLFGAGSGAAQTATQQREAAVLKARAGNMAGAQAALRAMLVAGTDDGLVAMDLTTLLQQDGRSGEAVAVFEKAARTDPPDYALLAATRAYRDLRRYANAARLAREGMQRFPNDTVWLLILSLVLSDEGKSAEALAILRQPAAQRAPPVERLLAEAYAWRRAGDPFKAMRVYSEAIKAAPANPGVRVEAAGVLQDMGAPFGAEMIAGTGTPSIAADQAAAMVRWGAQIHSSDPARRFDGTDAALARLDQLLAALPPPPAEAGLRRRLRLDRMVALRNCVRMQEAVEEGEALSLEGPLPQYAEEAYADALLYLRRPEAARDAYERVLVQNPKDVAARYGKFYASVDLGDFNTAYATIDALVGDEPIWRSYKDDPSRYDNPERAYAQVTAAQARFYGNQLGEAWERITKFSNAAPANPNGRLALYQIANARGWPQRATAEGEIAASLAPRDVGSKIALIEVAMMNYRSAEAQRMMAELLAQYPEDQAVRRLARDLDAKRRWLFEAEARPSNSDGGGANASGQALILQGRLTTPPIADNWRLFATADYANAHPPEGFAERARAGAGVEWRIPNVTATIYPTQSWGTLPRAGGVATVDWLVTDQVRLAFAGELYTWDTPLRALLFGITADEYAAKATYRWHESRSVAASFAYLPFTDGNQRFTGGMTFKERLINVPGFDLTALAEAYASSNNQPNAPYYNPTRDLSLTSGLLAEHVLWRRYDNSLVQALTVDAGLYSEYGFPDNWIGTLNYEHRWRFDPLTEFRYGVMLTRRVYDGSVENTLTFIIGLRQRI
jgi:biofilm PGA synthesis protein PgaA